MCSAAGWSSRPPPHPPTHRTCQALFMRSNTGPFDQRLLDRAREVRTLLAADVALGVVVAMLVLVQATVLADVITRGFDGAGAGALWLPLGVLVLCFAARGLVGWSFEVAGRRAATTVLSKLRLGVVQRRLLVPSRVAGQPPQRRTRDRRGVRRRAARGVLRKAAAADGARVHRAGGGDRVGGGDRPGIGRHHAADAAAGARLHDPDRHLYAPPHRRAAGRAGASGRPFPGCRAGSAHPAGAEPRRRSGRVDRTRRRAVPQRDDGHAEGGVPVRGGARAGRDRGCCAGGGDRWCAARRRRPGPAAGADGADPGSRAVRAAAHRRHALPHQCRWAGRGRDAAARVRARTRPAGRTAGGADRRVPCGSSGCR